MKPPRRMFTLEVRIGGDTREDVYRALRDVVVVEREHLRDVVLGGPSLGYTIKFSEDPAMTHENYHAALDAYLATDKEPRELHCEDCDRDYPVWVTPNELWNTVVRADADAAGVTEPFLCLTCFAIRAENRGVRPTAWIVRPERPEDMPRTSSAQGEESK